MRRRGLGAVVAFLLLPLVAGCTVATDATRLTERDDGATLTLKPGAEFEAVVATNPSTGFTWVWPNGGAGTVIEPVGTPRFDRDVEDAIRTGSGGSETWRFRAVRPGRETVRLEYRRAWEAVSPPERTFTFTAEVVP
jgi:inhibitor of cysteine peptidase